MNIWKVVTATTVEHLAQRLSALNAAGFIVHTILRGESGSGFTVIAYSTQA
jgi:nucleoside-triphosphatase THEP1